MGKWPTHTVLHLLCISRSVATHSCLLCALQSFLTCFFGVWEKLKYSSGGFTLPFISLLTYLDHNSPHVSSMYIIPSTVLHVSQHLSSYILYLSVRYSFNQEFKQNYIILTVDSFRPSIIVFVFLFLPPWRWPHEWPICVGGCHKVGLVYLLICLVTTVTMETSIRVYSLCIRTQLLV